jgi:hypothetical protein
MIDTSSVALSRVRDLLEPELRIVPAESVHEPRLKERMRTRHRCDAARRGLAEGNYARFRGPTRVGS